MRAQYPWSLNEVSPFAGSRNNGIHGSVWSPVKVDRPSSSPPGGLEGTAVAGALGAVGGTPAEGAFAAVERSRHAESALRHAQPNARTLTKEKRAAAGRLAWFGSRTGFFIVRGAVFSQG